MLLRTILVLLCCLVVAALTLPLKSDQKASSGIQSRQRRSMFSPWRYGHGKRSRIDFFDKLDFNFDGYLDKTELALIYLAIGASWEEAQIFGEQQLRHDLDHNGVLDRWEFIRDNDLMPYWPF